MKAVRIILLILHVGIFLLLSGMLMNAYVPPKVFPWVNLLSLGFPVLIITYVLLTIFWIICWKKRAFIFIFLGFLFFNPVLRWINFSGKSSSEIENADLKIISLNAKNATFGLKNIEAYIDRQQADIVLLQEYGYGTDYHFNGLKEGEKNAGVAFFTRHKVISQKKIIEGSYEHNNAYVTQTDIEIKGKIYRIINMYLQPFQFEKSMIQLDGNIDKREEKLKNIVKRLIPTFKMHQEQIIPIRESIETSPYPVILAGDFNAVPNSYEYYHLADGLQDAFVKAGNGSSTSFHEYKFPIRIDYVFCSESIQPLSYKVDRSVRLSDHYPVITTFKLDN